jgi:hypothetical protein
VTGEDVTIAERILDTNALYVTGWWDRARVVEAAVDLMVRGVDVPGVVALAGDDHADRYELERDLADAIRQLDQVPPSRSEIAFRAARWLARAVLANQVDARAAAGAIWDVYVLTDYTDAIGDIANIADGLFCTPEFVTESSFRAACTEFLASENGSGR